MKQAFLFCLSFVLALSAVANDSQYFANGNQLIPLRQANIAVVKELLQIRICTDGFAEVDVFYEFDNRATAKTILMGFETSTPYFFDESGNKQKNDYIKDFIVELNGKQLPYQVAMVEEGKTVDEKGRIQPINWNVWQVSEIGMNGTIVRRGTEDYSKENSGTCVYAYYFDASFLRGKNQLHHHYRYKMANGIDFNYGVAYKLSPAMRWANQQIDDFTLEIIAENTVCDFYLTSSPFDTQMPEIKGAGKYRQHQVYGQSVMEIVLRNATATFHVDQFKPQKELYIKSASGYESSGFNIMATQKLSPENFVYEPMSQPFSFLAENEDLKKISKKDRHIIRNLPFAARGYLFKSPDLSRFFQQCWWYMPDPTGKALDELPLTESEHIITKAYNF